MAEGSGARRGRKKPNPAKRKRQAKRASARATEESYNRLYDFFRHLSGASLGAADASSGAAGSSSGAEGAISDILTLMLGSVPSIAVGETMLTASQAQGQMLANAVANQQKTNIVSMVATVGCVAQLLDMSPGKLWRDVEMDEEEELEDEFEESED